MEREIKTKKEAYGLATFVEEFLLRLNWQIKKGLLMDREYHYLTGFQRSITQASAESSSVASRAIMLEEEHKRWMETKELRGDAVWKKNNPGLDPSVESRR